MYVNAVYQKYFADFSVNILILINIWIKYYEKPCLCKRWIHIYYFVPSPTFITGNNFIVMGKRKRFPNKIQLCTYIKLIEGELEKVALLLIRFVSIK